MSDLPGLSAANAYDLWAGSYDTDENDTRELAGETLRRSGLARDGRDVVEIGCGTGGNTAWLAEGAGSVLGLDLSEGMLERARRRTSAPHVRFRHHDVRAPWPVESAAADLVVSMLVLEHVEGVGPVLAEAARVLRPGGALFLCELHPTRQRLGRQAEFAHPETGETQRIAAFFHDASDYVNAAVDAGLRVRRMEEPGDADAGPIAPPRLLVLVLGKE
ncbi:MAG: class I SAM-dependent methyltransferase [Thermoanaerobaculia bacterium]